MKKILILLALIAQMLTAAQISYKIDDEAYKTSSSVYLKPNQKLTMRFNVKLCRIRDNLIPANAFCIFYIKPHC